MPTPVVHVRLRAPRASMEPAPDLETPAKASPLWPKYGARLERDSAAEALAKRVERSVGRIPTVSGRPRGVESTRLIRLATLSPTSSRHARGKRSSARSCVASSGCSESASSASDVGSPFCAPTRPLLASAVILQGRGIAEHWPRSDIDSRRRAKEDARVFRSVGASTLKRSLFAVACLCVLVLVPVAGGSHTPAPTSVGLPGSFGDELGCPGDWQPDCSVTQLAFDAEDRVWQGAFDVPAGSWEYKAALNGSWDENYGAARAAGRRQHRAHPERPRRASSSTTTTPRTGSRTTTAR